MIEGLSVTTYYGGLTNTDNCYCSSCVTADSSVVAEFEMDRYIKGPYAYAQYAVLYYNDACECCIRVFNYRFRVSTDYMTVEMDGEFHYRCTTELTSLRTSCC